MSQKFHIDKNGKPAVCHAKKMPCPLGGEESHFESEEKAQIEADYRNEAEIILSEEYSETILKRHKKNPVIRQQLVLEYGTKIPYDNDYRVREAQILNGQYLEEAFKEESTRKIAEEYLKKVAELDGKINPVKVKLFNDNEYNVLITKPILNEAGDLMYQVDPEKSSEAFSKELQKCYDNSPSGKQVSVKSPNELKEETHFMLVNSTGGSGAIVTKNKEISGVFSNKPKERFIKKSFPILRNNNGTWLNCYNTFLPKVYEKEGMSVVGTMPYNPEYEPPGFNREYFYNNFPQIRDGLIFMSFDKKEVKHFEEWDDVEQYAKGEKDENYYSI